MRCESSWVESGFIAISGLWLDPAWRSAPTATIRTPVRSMTTAGASQSVSGDSAGLHGVAEIYEAMSKTARRSFGVTGLCLMYAFSLCATNSPAPVDTNFIDPAITADNPALSQLNEVLKAQGVKTESLLDEHFLFASLLWGSVAGGYLLYARKQREIPPFLGGVAMMGASFLVTSWFWMSVICLALMAGVYLVMKRG